MADLDYKALFEEMVDDLVEQKGPEDACYYFSYLVSIQDLHEKLRFDIETIDFMVKKFMDEEERSDRVSPDTMVWLEQKIKEEGVSV